MKKLKLFINIKFLSVLIAIEVICLLIVVVVNVKNRVPKTYVRDTKSVIEPILSEAIIDRKVGAKELIMTCISNLINKGNIECINILWDDYLTYAIAFGISNKVTDRFGEELMNANTSKNR